MIELAQNFNSDILFEEFCKQYVIDYGNSKLEKIALKVSDSINVKLYIQDVISKNSIPQIDDIQYVLNTHTFFYFSREETVCLAGLVLILKWSNLKFLANDEQHEKTTKNLMIEFIDNCSRLKYNQFNGFFNKFERRLRLMIINQ